MIIALPERDHGHLADALVRDLGFTRTHVDAPLRDLLLALDPFVDSGVTLANMGPSPRLSSKLEQVGGGSVEERWDRLLHPPRPGAVPDRTATEVTRLLNVLRVQPTYADVVLDAAGDVVVVGVIDDAPEGALVAISDRFAGEADHWITPAGVVGEQEAIVAYVKELRAPKVGGVAAVLAEPADSWQAKAVGRAAARASSKFVEAPHIAGTLTDAQLDELAEAGIPEEMLDEMAALIDAQATENPPA